MRSLLRFILLLALVAGSGLVAAPAGAVPANVRVNQDTAASPQRPQNEPAIAVVPDSGALVAGANDYRLGNPGCGLYRSTDGGTTWSDVDGDGAGPAPAAILPGIRIGAGGIFAAAGDPAIAAAGSNVYYVCLAFNTTSPFKAALVVSRSTDGGLAWSTNPVQVASGSGVRGPFPDKPAIAAWGSNVLVCFTKFNGSVRAPIQCVRSADNGQTFSKPATITPFGFAANQGSAIGVGASNRVYVAFENFNTSPPQFWLAVSTNGGQSFGAPQPIRAMHNIPSPLANTAFRTNSFPQLAVCQGCAAGGADVLYAVWAENVSTTNQADIFFIQCDDGTQCTSSANWSAALTVNGVTTNAQFFPAVSIAPNQSRLDVVFYDRRNDTTTTPDHEMDVFYARGTIGAGGLVASFTNQQVTDQIVNPDLGTDFDNASGQTRFIGDYIGVAATNANAHAVWTDTRNSSQDIFAAKVTP